MKDATTFLDSLFMPEKNEGQLANCRSMVLNAEQHLEWDLLAATYEYERGLTRMEAETEAMNAIVTLMNIDSKSS